MIAPTADSNEDLLTAAEVASLLRMTSGWVYRRDPREPNPASATRTLRTLPALRDRAVDGGDRDGEDAPSNRVSVGSKDRVRRAAQSTRVTTRPGAYNTVSWASVTTARATSTSSGAPTTGAGEHLTGGSSIASSARCARSGSAAAASPVFKLSARWRASARRRTARRAPRRELRSQRSMRSPTAPAPKRSPIFAHAKRRKFISDNPVSEATRPGRQRAGDADPDLQFLTVAELDAVLRAIPDGIVIRKPKPTRRGRRGPARPPPPDVLGPVLWGRDRRRGDDRTAPIRAARSAVARCRLGRAANPRAQHLCPR